MGLSVGVEGAVRPLIQVSSLSRRGAAQLFITASNASSQVTSKRPRRNVRASEREQWNPSSGRMARCRGSTQKISGSSRLSAIGKMPLR